MYGQTCNGREKKESDRESENVGKEIVRNPKIAKLRRVKDEKRNCLLLCYNLEKRGLFSLEAHVLRKPTATYSTI